MSEVYFNAPNMKVFDVVLNGDLTVSSDLDIFEKVRQGTMENTRETFSGWPRGGAWWVHWVLHRGQHNPVSGFNSSYFFSSSILCFSKRSSSILCHNLITTQGWRERDQRREDPGWVHQELQGQPQDQRHRPDQGEGAKNSFQPLTAALWLFRGPWRTSPSWLHSLLSQRRMKLPMISKFVQIIFRTGLFWYWSNPKSLNLFRCARWFFKNDFCFTGVNFRAKEAKWAQSCGSLHRGRQLVHVANLRGNRSFHPSRVLPLSALSSSEHLSSVSTSSSLSHELPCAILLLDPQHLQISSLKLLSQSLYLLLVTKMASSSRAHQWTVRCGFLLKSFSLSVKKNNKKDNSSRIKFWCKKQTSQPKLLQKVQI